jgi:outer membrane protein
MRICNRASSGVIFALAVFGASNLIADVQNASTTQQQNPIETKAGDWITRARALYIYPYGSSGSLSTIPNTGVSVIPSWTGEIDIGYMFTKNLGSELILGTSCNTIRGTKGLSGTKIGTTWLLPPTLTLQWRFLPSCRFQPYVGGGVNYTLFYGEACSLPGTHLSLRHSWGPAVQFGSDIFVTNHWFFNADVKYIWMWTKAYLTGAVPGSVHVNVNPWVLGMGVGYKW